MLHKEAADYGKPNMIMADRDARFTGNFCPCDVGTEREKLLIYLP